MISSFDITPLSKIPQFRLIGSKHSILNNLYEVMKKEEITGKRFFDVFSGSTSVSRYFKKTFSIISNDNLYFSYVLQRTLIVLNEYPKFDNLKILNISSEPEKRVRQVLEFLNKSIGIEGFIFKHYTPASKITDGIKRKYFSEENGKKIDSIRKTIEEEFIKKYITGDEYFYLIASLLMAVQKVSNISGTYGAFNKIWDPRAKKTLTLKFIEIIPSKFKHKALNGDSFDLIKKINCDIAYIDPPYNSRQYITNYHLLETIAKYDNPKISGKTGIRRYTEKEKSVFCSKRTVSSALLKLLNGLNARYIILSYNSEGLLSKDGILKIFKESKFKKVKLYKFPYRRFKSNHNSHNNKIKEYIFVGK